ARCVVLLPDEMLTDHLGMDIQHEEIFSRIEYLPCWRREDESVWLSRCLPCWRYLGAHFLMEGQLPPEAGLEFSMHKRQHARNLHLLNKALGEVAQGSMAPSLFLRTSTIGSNIPSMNSTDPLPSACRHVPALFKEEPDQHFRICLHKPVAAMALTQ
ncbi:MAG: hypothetical protein IPO00_17265, partial [Betaproteobacteria bacterium]|nr:hypothetical protein [Betaproteobacteria bacterium]